MNPIDAAWERLEAFLATTDCADELGPPASDADRVALQERAGGWIPAALLASLARHDGFSGMALGFTFPSTRGVLALWKAQQGAEGWGSDWLPIGTDEAGSFLCLDLVWNNVFEWDRAEGSSPFAETLEELLTWLADVVERDRPRLDDPDGDLVDADGELWEPHPDDDEPTDAIARRVARWRDRVEEDDPRAFDLFRETFRAPDGAAFDRVRVPGEPTRLDWYRLRSWAERNGDVRARIDAHHGWVQAGLPHPKLPTVEEWLAESPDDVFLRYLRGLMRFFTQDPQGAYDDMDVVLRAQPDALGPLSVRALAGADLGKPGAVDDLRAAGSRGAWLPGQCAVRERLAELEG